jgi:hypothetical protein
MQNTLAPYFTIKLHLLNPDYLISMLTTRNLDLLQINFKISELKSRSLMSQSSFNLASGAKAATVPNIGNRVSTETNFARISIGILIEINFGFR